MIIMNMKRILQTMMTVMLILSLTGAAFAAPAEGEKSPAGVREPEKTLFQVSTFSALQQGYYQGSITCGELKNRGDFGLGTFEGLDGEMVMLDGKIYQIRPDGRPVLARDETQVPFADVTFFRGSQLTKIMGKASLQELQRDVSKLFANPNFFYGIRVDGTFKLLRLRSVAKQEIPYPSLQEAVAGQTVFEYQNIKGTLVGFWAPEYTQGMAVAGFHFHFISDDRRQGGHVLDCALYNGGTLQITGFTDLHLMFPSGEGFGKLNLANSAGIGGKIE